MPYAANVVNVMIASPGDVDAERDIARNVIAEWNVMHAERNGLVLLAMAWDTHSAPELGDRPQVIINRQVLERADLLVAIFHSRLGTPTGEAESGTAEEIARNVDADRPTMLYFSDVPIRPSEIDVNQRAKLDAFKAEMRPTGVVEFFDTREVFRQKFARQLNDRVMENFGAFARVREPQDTSASLRLSAEAATLLFHATRTDGRIGQIQGGEVIFASGLNMLDDEPDARSIAVWHRALQQLVTAKFARPVGRKGEMYKVTAEGFEEMDRLKTAGFEPPAWTATST